MGFRRVVAAVIVALVAIVICPVALAQAIYVNGATQAGVWVREVGPPVTSFAFSTLDDGIEVTSANGRGLFVGGAAYEGVFVYRSAGDGVVVSTAGSTLEAPISSPLNNGLEVQAAQGNGIFVGAVGSNGVHVESGVTGGYFNSDVSNGNGLVGQANAGSLAFGVWGISSSGYAGYFSGKVNVTGTLTKSAGTFRIDHPLDPENKFLSHSFVESPDMKNIYDGVVALDERGEAVIELPEYFEALNRDFRYQLTTIGAAAPVYISDEIHDGRFAIAGGTEGLKVSWQVTGIRKDPYATDHPVEVEEWKPDAERGRFLYPAGYGMPDTLSIDPAQAKPVPSQPVVYNPSDLSRNIVHQGEASSP